MRIDNKKKITIGSLVIFILVLIIFYFDKDRLLAREIAEHEPAFDCKAKSANVDLKDPRRFIAHAGGAFKGSKYTNTLEAITESISKGYKLIELDLMLTSDGEIVAMHDWNIWRNKTGSQIAIPTLRQFLDAKALDGTTHLDLQAIIKIFKDNSDLILVTDKIRDLEALKSRIPFQDRLFVEVFSIKDYVRALKIGLKFPLLSIASAGEAKALKFAKKFKVHHIVLKATRVAGLSSELSELVDAGTCIHAYSSNEVGFYANHFDKNIFGVYTDHWNVKSGLCDSNASNCTTY